MVVIRNSSTPAGQTSSSSSSSSSTTSSSSTRPNQTAQTLVLASQTPTKTKPTVDSLALLQANATEFWSKVQNTLHYTWEGVKVTGNLTWYLVTGGFILLLPLSMMLEGEMQTRLQMSNYGEGMSQMSAALPAVSNSQLGLSPDLEGVLEQYLR